MGPEGCKQIRNILTNSKDLRELYLDSSHPPSSGVRYIFDGLLRNQGLQIFNFAHNSIFSQHYEFSVKIAKTLTRHEELMHLDLTDCNISKEEIIFIGMTLPLARSLIAIHLSANGLSYKDRLFLR